MISRRAALTGSALALTGASPARALVRLRTELGAIVIELRADRAPRSAGDFLHYVDSGAYDGGRFFRVVGPRNDHGSPPIDVIQGGVRPGSKVGPPVPHEPTSETGLRHLDGTVSLPRDKPGSGSGSEFFICLGRQPALDAGGTRNPDRQGFAAFGQVVSGMEVVRRIWALDPSGPSPDAYTRGQMLRNAVPIVSAHLL